MPPELPRRGLIAFAIAFPCALWAIHADLGHRGDIGFFFEWYGAFREGPAFYRDGPGLNYPIVGVLLVCGPAWIVEQLRGAPLDLEAYRVVLKATLVIGESLFVLAAAAAARALGVRRPNRLAVILALVPGTWAVGAWFGQLDVWGSMLLLASAGGLARYARRAPSGGRATDLALGLAAFHAALLTKQLTWFAAPGLLLVLALGLRAHAGWRHRLAALASFGSWLVVDPLLVLPDGQVSHLLFVLRHGSSHGELAVASGASVWSLFVAGGTEADALRWLGIGGFAWGWIAWSVAQLLFVAVVLRRGLSPRRAVLFAGFSHLAMATLLTGVHERYLAHAVPLLCIADVDAPPARRALGWSVAVLSGVFVLSTIHEDAFVGPLGVLARPEPLALLGLAWLASFFVPPVRVTSEG